MRRQSPFKPVKKNTFFPPNINENSSLTLGSDLPCLLSVNMMYRVLLLQGGQIYCCTLLIPEIGMETFF
jgi:hypothetical protein